MRVCSRCKTLKPPEAFGKERRCKRCNVERAREYQNKNQEMVKAKRKKAYAKNAAQRKAYTTAYRKANPEKVALALAKWRSANLDKIQSQHRAWKLANPEKVAISIAAYRARHPERIRKRSRDRYHANPQRAKDSFLKKRYKMSLDQYNEMLAAQSHQCAICQKNQEECSKSFHVDHDHNTGSVRALLCSQCNTALGLLQEDADLIERAAHYIRSHAGQTLARSHQ